MANPWFRVWGDMVNDPKWRTIARKSGQKIGDVIAVYLHMLTCASNADERGHTDGWCDEDVATALDIDTEQVEAIREAMQGRVLDGDYLTGWEKRQPKREREDSEPSTSRVQAFRARQRNETPCNANETQETPREEEIRVEEKREEGKSKAKASAAPKQRKPTKTSLPADFSISEGVRAWAASKGFDRLEDHFESFIRKAAANGYTYANWDLALQNAIADDWAKLRTAQARASPAGHPTLGKAGQATAAAAQRLLERMEHEQAS